MTDMTDDDQRDDKGRFGPGNKAGKGRARVRPLREVVTFEEEGKLWKAHLELAKTDASAREFLLRHCAGNPPQAAPELPDGIEWPAITCTEDLMGAVNAMLAVQRDGRLDGAGLKFLTGIILDLARVFETVDMAPRLRKIEEHIAAQAALQGANQ